MISLWQAKGVRNGMWVKRAKQLCPELLVMPYEFDKYAATAEAMYQLVFERTPHTAGVRCSFHPHHFPKGDAAPKDSERLQRAPRKEKPRGLGHPVIPSRRVCDASYGCNHVVQRVCDAVMWLLG